jgi:hypothetical protein
MNGARATATKRHTSTTKLTLIPTIRPKPVSRGLRRPKEFKASEKMNHTITPMPPPMMA